MVERHYPIPAREGQAIFETVCQGCHMHDGNGAIGAGKYPKLRSNSNLETAAYPISVILHGQKAMPPFAQFLNDQQISAVVNYIRSSLGNHYKDVTSPAEVEAQR